MSDRPAIPPLAPDTMPLEPWNQDDIPTEPGVEPNAYPNPPPLPPEPEEEAPPTLPAGPPWEDEEPQENITDTEPPPKE